MKNKDGGSSRYLFIIAYRNVKAHWRQSLAALLSIAAAFASIVLFEGYVKDIGFYYDTGHRYRGMFGDILIENVNMLKPPGKKEPWKYMISKEQQDEISQLLKRWDGRVEASVKRLIATGLISNGKTSSIFFALAFDLEQGLRMRKAGWEWNALYGLPLHKSENADVLNLGQGLGRVLGCVPAKKTISSLPRGGYAPENRPFKCENESMQLTAYTESGHLNALDLNVAGLVDGGYSDLDSKYILLSLENGQKLINTDKISMQTVLFKETQDVHAFAQDFKNSVGKKYPELETYTWENHPTGEMYKKTMELFNVFRNFVAIVILSISCLSVFNTQIKAVKERTREIGTLLSLGFYRHQVISLFVIEALMLAALGIISGFIFTLVSMLTINNLGVYYKAGLLSEPILFHIMASPETMLLASLGLFAITALSSYLTCRSTVNKKVIECLTHA